jgi:hypothetical protein
MRTVIRYSTHFGLSGCYMPDSYGGPFECTTRKELAEYIRDELAMYGLPANLFGRVRIRRLWSAIKTRGSSSYHFSLNHGNHSLVFNGLTEDEFNQMSQDQ